MSGAQKELVLAFPGSTANEASRYATDLRSFLLDVTPTVQLRQRSERSDSQDLGSTLVLVLGTTAVGALARGIAVWLQRNAGARITVRTVAGELVAEGLDSKDVARIVEALSNRPTLGE